MEVACCEFYTHVIKLVEAPVHVYKKALAELLEVSMGGFLILAGSFGRPLRREWEQNTHDNTTHCAL